MTIPKNFRNTQETAIASYDYIDIAEGTGIVTFNLAVSAIATPTYNYLLTKNTVYSDETHIRSTNTTTTFNFDLTPFNLPQTLNGTAILSSAFWLQTAGGDKSVKVTLKKVSDATTSISSQITAYIPAAGNAKMALIELPITTKTHFKKGDILRCEVIIQSSTDWIEMGTDPEGRDGNSLVPSTNPGITTSSKLFIPFDLDL